MKDCLNLEQLSLTLEDLLEVEGLIITKSNLGINDFYYKRLSYPEQTTYKDFNYTEYCEVKTIVSTIKNKGYGPYIYIKIANDYKNKIIITYGFSQE